MDRRKSLLGNNIIDITIGPTSGLETTEPLIASVQLNGQKLTDITADAVSGVFTFYDMQMLLPEFKFPYPEFSDFIQFNVDAIKTLRLNLTQKSGFSASEEYLVLLNSGRSITTAVDYSLRKPIPYLTNQPKFKKSTKFTPQWFFLPLNFDTDSPTELHLKITALDKFGEGTAVVLKSLTTVINNTILAIDVSPYRVLEFLPEETVAYYFQLFDEVDEVVSEARYIRLVDDYEEDFTLTFRNSFGVWDTFTFQGSQSRAISNQPLVTSTRRNIEVESSSFFRTLRLKISGIDVRWQIYFQELILSREIYLLENGNHRLVSETKNFDYLDSSKYTENLVFDFRFAAIETSY